MNFQKLFFSLKNDKTFRTKIITYTTMVYNFFWSILKIFFGFFMRTYLYCISGIYTLLFGFIKKIFISNHSNKDVNLELKSLIIGILLTISGVAFGLYMGRLFFYPDEKTYGLVWSIAIAVCSFVELGLAIYNMRKVRKREDILLFSLRCCNLSSSLFAIVLTQVALLSATKAVNSSTSNAITGVIVGILVMLIGLFVIGISFNKNKQNNAAKNQNQNQMIIEANDVDKEKK